jgi:hypothetical protein
MELQNIKNRGGRIVNTGTPWHVEDCFSLMPEPRKWDWKSVPEIISAEEIEHIRARMTPSLFAANYELRHIPSDDVIFTDPKTGAPIELVYHGICHVDAAYYGEDYTAFTAMAVHDGKYYVYGKLWRKHVDDCMPLIMADYQRLMLGRLYTETNADKGYSARAFKERGASVVPYAEHENKHIKIVTYLKQVWPDVVFVNGTRPGNQAVVDIAKSQVGNVGGQPYWSWYGFNSRVEWCACFVSWCYGQMGLSEPRFAACQSQGIPWFQSHGQWGGRDYANIAPGDAIFFDWDLDGSADHVGLVVGTDGSRVYTVEGNSGDACKIKSYSLSYECIKGYGLMNW